MLALHQPGSSRARNLASADIRSSEYIQTWVAENCKSRNDFTNLRMEIDTIYQHFERADKMNAVFVVLLIIGTTSVSIIFHPVYLVLFGFVIMAAVGVRIQNAQVGWTKMKANKDKLYRALSNINPDDIIYQPSAVQQSSPPSPSSADELKKFAELRDQGVITEEDFQKKKNELLGL